MKRFYLAFFFWGIRIECPYMAFSPPGFSFLMDWNCLYILSPNWNYTYYPIWGLGLAPIYRISCPRIWICFAPHQKACHNARIGIGIGGGFNIAHSPNPNSEPHPNPNKILPKKSEFLIQTQENTAYNNPKSIREYSM